MNPALARRRHLALSRPMPPSLAWRFTVGELAVFKIVSDEVRQHGHCDRTVAEIAARAGCSRTSCQKALRLAASLGLVTIEGRQSLPSITRIVSREWLAWIKQSRPRWRVGEQHTPSTF